MKILLVQNCAIEGFGLYQSYLVTHGVEYALVHADQGTPLPPLSEVDAVMIGGTPISAYAAHKPAFLLREIDYLRGVLRAQKPCLGICCGAQMLAQLLGAAVRRCPRPEIGGYTVRLTPAGQESALLAGFPPHFPVFHWHGDTFDIPAGAALLAEGDRCRNQLFQRDNVVGLQFHLEVTADQAARWAEAYADEPDALGKSKEQVIEECLEREEQMQPLADRLMDHFLQLVL